MGTAKEIRIKSGILSINFNLKWKIYKRFAEGTNNFSTNAEIYAIN